MIRVAVFTGFGINCDKEMQLAWEKAGAIAHIIHLSSLLRGEIDVEDYDVLSFPGGFTFADDLGAGKALANRLISKGIPFRLQEFVKKGGAILGVCNGFQLLVKLGLLSGGHDQKIALAANASARFQNSWVKHTVNDSRSLFTKGLKIPLYLPVRHAEGRFVASYHVLEELKRNRQIALCYDSDVNGSVGQVAAVCDSTGLVLGMMAHPEAAFLKDQCPYPAEDPPGNRFFLNAILRLSERKCQNVPSQYAEF